MSVITDYYNQPRVYQPRMHAVLTIPPIPGGALLGSSSGASGTRINMRVRRATIIRNDHNHADELKLRVEWADSGIDVRLLFFATVEFYMGNADERGNWQPNRGDLKFVGVMTRPQRIARDDGLIVEMEFLDYTTFFLSVRQFASSGYPKLSMTLSEAWRLICDYTGSPDPHSNTFKSTVTALRDSIEFRGGAADATIGKAIASRFQNIGAHVQPKNMGKEDSWAVWQRCVGMLGLISFIELDKCVVTTSTALYTADDPPLFTWGTNLLSMSEARNPFRGGVAAGIVSYDPLGGRTIESVYPPPNDDRVFRKKIAAKRLNDPDAIREAADIEYFEYYGITDQSVLDEIARRVYEERSRQEMEGTVRTVEMIVPTVKENFVNTVDIKPGSVVQVLFEDKVREILDGSATDRQMIGQLMEMGYSDELSKYMVDNYRLFTKLQQNYYVAKLEATLESESDGGLFEVLITYKNRIYIDQNSLTYK